MSTLTQTHAQQAEHGSPDKLKVAIGSAVGTTIENYDFLAYGTAAALYFGSAFFPGQDPLAATLLAFATLAVGFAMRPLGGLIGGYLGDKYGRKPVLVGALLVMGAATFLIGVLPTYQQVGVLAPILLVAIRIIQGLAFGAEWGGAIMMTFEHAPWRKRGQYTGIPQAGVPLGLLLANLVFLGTTGWNNEWSWRVPFLASSILIIAGIIIRMKVSESPEFEETKARGELVKNPLLTVVREDWRNILRVIGLRLAESGGFYVIVTYLLSYISTNKIVDRQVGLTGLVLAAAIGVAATILWGRVTDRIGRRKLYLAGCAGIILFGFPMFLMVNTAVPFLIVLVYVVGLPVLHDMLAGAQGAWFSELFNANTRTSGASIGYQFSAAISGFIPLIAAATAAAWGWSGVSIVYIACGVIGLIAALSTRETWSSREQKEVETLIASGK
ncbi:MHS family MFS transporter [Arthrobacter sp. FW305-BF8]|uniref:MFS transporter n=2 Tax=Arthrobacter TaxID=1663 RepID=UPI001F1E5937|nr:MFS transporter [Arthrobacter sp. FW305-BF8]UKA54102.1 MHS family MFS transporter [Arthrobacter sp. FW305-BF8]